VEKEAREEQEEDEESSLRKAEMLMMKRCLCTLSKLRKCVLIRDDNGVLLMALVMR
jgi:hypothetical protein